MRDSDCNEKCIETSTILWLGNANRLVEVGELVLYLHCHTISFLYGKLDLKFVIELYMQGYVPNIVVGRYKV